MAIIIMIIIIIIQTIIIIIHLNKDKMLIIGKKIINTIIQIIESLTLKNQ